jgi:hypothetical protein
MKRASPWLDVIFFLGCVALGGQAIFKQYTQGANG